MSGEHDDEDIDWLSGVTKLGRSSEKGGSGMSLMDAIKKSQEKARQRREQAPLRIDELIGRYEGVTEARVLAYAYEAETYIGLINLFHPSLKAVRRAIRGLESGGLKWRAGAAMVYNALLAIQSTDGNGD